MERPHPRARREALQTLHTMYQCRPPDPSPARGKVHILVNAAGITKRALEEVIGAAVFLASDAASFVTGTVLPVGGGVLASGVNQ